MKQKKWIIILNNNVERWLMLLFYSIIVITIGTEVFRRFVLSYSSSWAEEVARYAFIYLVWIGVSAGVRERRHIRIDVIMHFFGNKFKLFLYFIGDLIMLIVAIFALYLSYETLVVSIKYLPVTDGLRVPKAWALTAVPFGFLLVCFRLIQSVYRDISDFREGRNVFSGEKLFD